MKLSKEQVLDLAKLARLKLTPEEETKAPGQLSSILDYVDQLQQVDTKNVPETNQITGLEQVTRVDVVEKEYIKEEMLASVPEVYADQVKTKKVL